MFKSLESILLFVDVQPKTIKGEKGKVITDEIVKLINFKWDSIYAVKWFSEENSTFHLARKTLLSEKEAGDTDIRIEKYLTLATFPKQAPSSFSNKELAQILEKEKVDGKNIFVVGFDYDDCVLSTVLDGHSRNLRIFAVNELCGNAERKGSIDKNLIPSARLLLKNAGCLISLQDIMLV
ncbi:isochorismatase family protein [Sulfurimonas sp.]